MSDPVFLASALFRRSIARRTLLAALPAVVLATSAAWSQDAGKEVVIRIGTSNNYGFTPTFPHRGDDRIPGFRFEIIPFAGGTPQLIAALNAGELDIAEMGEVGPVIAHAGGLPFKIIAATEPWGKGQAILVNEDSPIKTAADLKGKRIAYVRGTNSHWIVVKALESVNLTTKDIESVSLPPGMNQQSVLESGNIDAATAIASQLVAFESSGSRRLLDGTDVGAENPLYYIATDKVIEEKREGIAGFVRQLSRHLAWTKENPEERAEAVGKILRLDPKRLVRGERDRPGALRPIGPELIANNQKISDLFLEQGVVRQKLDASETFTDAFNSAIGQ